jgi:hypothetical protein
MVLGTSGDHPGPRGVQGPGRATRQPSRTTITVRVLSKGTHPATDVPGRVRGSLPGAPGRPCSGNGVGTASASMLRRRRPRALVEVRSCAIDPFGIVQETSSRRGAPRRRPPCACTRLVVTLARAPDRCRVDSSRGVTRSKSDGVRPCPPQGAAGPLRTAVVLPGHVPGRVGATVRHFVPQDRDEPPHDPNGGAPIFRLRVYQRAFGAGFVSGIHSTAPLDSIPSPGPRRRRKHS